MAGPLGVTITCGLEDGMIIRTIHYCPANGVRPTDKPFGVWELRGNLGCRDLNGDWA